MRLIIRNINIIEKNSQKTKMHFAVLSAPKMKGKFNM